MNVSLNDAMIFLEMILRESKNFEFRHRFQSEIPKSHRKYVT